MISQPVLKIISETDPSSIVPPLASSNRLQADPSASFSCAPKLSSHQNVPFIFAPQLVQKMVIPGSFNSKPFTMAVKVLAAQIKDSTRIFIADISDQIASTQRSNQDLLKGDLCTG